LLREHTSTAVSRTAQSAEMIKTDTNTCHPTCTNSSAALW